MPIIGTNSFKYPIPQTPMTFQSPIWLIVPALLIPALILFYVITEQRARKRLSKFAGHSYLEALIASYCPARRNIKATLLILCITLGCLALSRPQFGHTYREEKRRGVDFVIALDVSKSMLAEDIKPNRLERAKLAIQDLLENTKGDRVGLVAFAGSAFLQCPLTLDYDAFRQTLNSVNPEILSTQGTDIAGALMEAQASFAKDNNQKVVVMITDGEDLEAEGILQAKKAKEEGLTIYTVGVGLPEGELIPINNARGQREWLKDPSGNLVRTKLDEQTLKQIAVASHGAYVPLGATGEGLKFVYEHCLSLIPDQERESHLQKVPIERYQWPLALAIGCWIAHGLLGTRRSQKILANSAKLLLFSLCLFTPDPLQAFGFNKGKSLYKKGKYEEASQYFQKQIDSEPETAVHHYNLGITKLRNGEHKEAAEALTKALELEKENTDFQSEIYEARALSRYQHGESLQNEAPQEALALWQESQLDYSSANNLEKDTDSNRAETLQQSQTKLEKKIQQFAYQNGVELYREKNFDGAREAFHEALRVALPEKYDEIHYNLGNCGYKIGDLQLEQNPQETIKTWEAALKSYDEAIEARKGEPFQQAEKNREILRKRLEALKQQQQNQEPQDSDDSNKDDKKEEEEKNQQQEQNQEKSQKENEPQDSKNSEKQKDSEEKNKSQTEEGKQDKQSSEEAKKGEKSDPGEKQTPATPGQMTREQAMQLLEQLRAFERKLPLGNLENIRKKEVNDDRKGRSW